MHYSNTRYVHVSAAYIDKYNQYYIKVLVVNMTQRAVT